jgi:hypothetical protein
MITDDTALAIHDRICQLLNVNFGMSVSRQLTVFHLGTTNRRMAIDVDKANARVSKIVAYRGFAGSEYNRQHALMQARRRIHW